MNVCLLGVGYIPLLVIFNVSLGKSFGFTVQPDEIEFNEFTLSFEKIKESIGGFGTYEFFKRGANKILNRIKNGRKRIDRLEKSRVQLFINNQFRNIIAFLKERNDIFISQADKGGKIVIMHRNIYTSKMDQYIADNTKNHNYFKCNGMNLDYVKTYVEDKYNKLRISFNEFLINDDNKENRGFKCFPYGLFFEPYVIPRMYGCLKVHKKDMNIRPIISSTNHMGQNLMDWLLSRLNIIADHLGQLVNATGNEKPVKNR